MTNESDSMKEELRGTLIAAANMLNNAANWLEEPERLESKAMQRFCETWRKSFIER